MSAVKMNTFLQRMLKKSGNDELKAQPVVDKEDKKPKPGRAFPSRGNWLPKFGNCSSKKYQVLENSPARMTVLKPLDTSLLYNSNRRMPLHGSKSLCSPVTPVDMPDLESIIRDFEMGFHSPSKKSAPKTVETPKQQPKNFVRKIVAAFEVKYKPSNDLKASQDAKEAEETNKRFDILETKRKSGLFSSPFRSGSEDFRNSSKSFDTPKKSPGNLSRRSDIFSPPSRYSVEDSKAFRRSGMYGSPFVVSDDEENSQDPADETKNAEDGSMISTPSTSRAKSLEVLSSGSCSNYSSQSDIYSSPVHFECQDYNANSCRFFSLEQDASVDLDDTNTLDSIDLDSIDLDSIDLDMTLPEPDSIDMDMTLPEPDETIFLDELEGHELRKTSTAIDEYDRTEEDSLVDPPPVFRNDKTPKIIGAFLKKPIEVEDTSIDWIPITGKKLPRKRSLKKLLTSWVTKRSFDKRNSMFSSERNLCEETRELQDSGYEEKSNSSSSLTSLISITEALMQQEKSYIEPDRRNTFKSFRPRNSLDAWALQDAGNVSKQTKKLVLTEVPREQLKVDLGPVYPFPKMVTMSLNRMPSVAKMPAVSPPIIKPSLPKLPKHPYLSSIPKHPFVALTKLDMPEYNREPVVIKNSLYEVEFRKSCTDLNSSNSSLESHYDVPRRFLSKSETQIPEICKVELGKPSEAIYDTPRRRHEERPKSSVYEDTLSRKRKSAHIGEKQPLYHYYSSPTCEEPHYATVKPIYNGLYHSREILPNSGNTASAKDAAYAF